MRIGYVGTLARWGTCYSRLQALKGTSHEVCALDIDQILDIRSMSRVRRWLEFQPLGAGRTWKLNRAVIRFAEENKLDLLWVDKGNWMYHSTVRQLKRMKVFLVHHLTDALWPTPFRVRLFRYRLLATALSYDAYITSNRDDWRRLNDKMPGKVILTQLGYDHERFNDDPISDAEIVQKWSNEIIFIGHREPRTEQGIVSLIKAGLPVKVYGVGWKRRENKLPLLRGKVAGPVNKDEYVWALKLAKVALCFVSEWNYNQTSGRSYEIPACGTFMLAMRTGEHREHYVEGVEAEFFSTSEELIAKVRRYLADDELRKTIARQGRKRSQSSGYSWRDITLRDLKKVEEIYLHWTKSA